MSTEPMNAEAAEAIRIADKHLAGYPPRRRMALALDIQEAIVRNAGDIAAKLIADACVIARAVKPAADLCKNRQPQCRPDGGCLQCAADAGEACRPLTTKQRERAGQIIT